MSEIVFLSLQVAFLATALVLPLAILAAWALVRLAPIPRTILSVAVHLPLVLPPVVTGYVLLIVFGRRGIVGQFLDSIGLGVSFNWTGAALAAAVMAFPLVVRPIRLAFEQQDPQLDAMAATLGANGLRRFATIAIPLAVPGLLAGLVLGFAKALGEFGATITFVSNIPGETQTLSLAIYTLLQSPAGDDTALKLIGFSILLSVLAVLASEILTARMALRADR
ncbi:molybdate ABC transporter permease subunit [Pseudahrensia aquimaris]|uniref:Molybdenum transport system permease n=1 Tax=Pseudahrensia aquimaris TaxID=744461 RepID=A0ABW3FAP9_9HYPH